MAIQKINLGTEPHGVGGDSYRTANEKINSNFEEVGRDIQDVLDRGVTLRQDLDNPDKGATMVGYGDGTVADKLDEIVSGAVTEPFVNERVYTHNHDSNAHTELRTSIISEVSSHATDEADRAEAAAEVAMAAGWVYTTVAAGEASRVDGDYFWVVSANDSEVLALWMMGATMATDTGKRTVSSAMIDKIADFAPTNIAENGNFAQGSSGWTVSEGTLEVENGVATIFKNKGTLQIDYGELNRIADHKYYISMTLNTDLSFRFVSSGGNIGDVFRGGVASTIFTAPSSRSNWRIGVVSGSTSATGPVEISNFMVIDLTSAFGAGNEPTKEYMDSTIEELFNGYLDGSFYAQKRIVDLITKVEPLEKDVADLLEISYLDGYAPLLNTAENGNFAQGISGWTTSQGTLDIQNGVATIFKNEGNLDIVYTELNRIADHKYYISMTLNTDVRFLFISNGGEIWESPFRGGVASTIFTAPSSSSNWRIGIRSRSSAATGPVEISNFMVIDLTSAFGAGNEPTKGYMDNTIEELFNGYLDGYNDDYFSVKSLAKATALKVKGQSNQTDVKSRVRGLSASTDINPVMCAVKMVNSKDSATGYAEPPRPVGWLYYNPITYDFYYANGNPRHLEYLFTWDRSVTWDGSQTPTQYRPFITKDGDIIFVWRGDLSSSEPRHNPIVYPAGDYANPVEVDLGERIKPTAWLQNCGADYVYNQDVFLFAEYTRPQHAESHIWKVTKPITDPDNWQIKKSLEVSPSMKHMHTMSYDPYSGVLYATSGDDNVSSVIYSSDDMGETWSVALQGGRVFARVLNFVFTKTAAYWANDDLAHYFNIADRDENGVIDFSTSRHLQDLRPHPPSYGNAYIEEFNGVLILNRHDTYNDGTIDVLFWEIDTETLHTVATVGTVGGIVEEGEFAGRYRPWGFRMDALNMYPSKGSNEIVVGFNNPRNNIATCGNSLYGNHLGNLVLEVTKINGEFGLKITSISYNS